MHETADEKIARYLANLAAELAQDGHDVPDTLTARFEGGVFTSGYAASWIEPKR